MLVNALKIFEQLWAAADCIDIFMKLVNWVFLNLISQDVNGVDRKVSACFSLGSCLFVSRA